MISPKKKEAGFTLIECLIALALLTTLALISFTALHRMLAIKQGLQHRAQPWSAMQVAFARMHNDLSEAMPRPVRDINAASVPAFVLGPQGFILTRYTHQEKNSQKSAMERVRYSLVHGNLTRTVWAHLDRTANTPSYTETLMHGVQHAQYTIVDDHGQLQSDWQPTQKDSMQLKTQFPSMPYGLKVIIETKQGHFERLFALASSLQAVQGASS